MPELPDVEAHRRTLEATALDQRIVKTRVGDTYVLEDATPQGLGHALKGRAIREGHRHGKLLFGRLDGGRSLVLHFGMTGRLEYLAGPEPAPEHSRAVLRFANGCALAYVCMRKLGLVTVTEDEAAWLRRKEVGPDAQRVTWATFRQRLRSRRGQAKSTLMNQSVLAGIGNLCADEICFETGLHPKRTLDTLDDDGLRQLYDVRGHVLAMLIGVVAGDDELPEYTLLHHRERDGQCPRCGTSLIRITAAGRTSYFCPTCQPLA